MDLPKIMFWSCKRFKNYPLKYFLKQAIDSFARMLSGISFQLLAPACNLDLQQCDLDLKLWDLDLKLLDLDLKRAASIKKPAISTDSYAISI